jgi:DNA-binding transcriptional LysR family regulator
MRPSASAELETISDVMGTNILPASDFRNFRVSLNQWKMLHAVATCNSFSVAAEFLHVSQPSISYAIGKLEGQLGVPLLKLDGGKVELTEAGTALLERARCLMREAIALEKFAESLAQAYRLEN